MYTFVVIENENFFKEFFGKKKFGLINDLAKQNYYFKENTIESFLKNVSHYKTKESLVILWHLSASGVSEEQVKEKTAELETSGLSFHLKIGKSEHDIFLKKAEETKWFDVLGRGQYIKNFCSRCQWDVKKIIEASLISRFQFSIDKIKIELLRLFLPLNIDMQALEILWNKMKKAKENGNIREQNNYLDNIMNYFKEMRNTEDDFYKKKSNECYCKAKDLINKSPDMANKDKLKVLCGISGENYSHIHNFLSLLDEKKGKELKEEDIVTVINYFEKYGSSTDRWKKVSSFHQWYCALAECLIGEGDCK